MTKRQSVLILGLEPELVDFSEPGIPPGMTAEKVHAGLDLARKQLEARGLEVDLLKVDRGETAEAVVAATLAAKAYDCVVIGAGVRNPPSAFLLFEKLVNAVHRHAPDAAIAFNTRPDDSGDAAARWLGPARPASPSPPRGEP